MKYLTLEYIKDHSRICHNAEDRYLERIGAAAETAVLNLCRRTIEDIYEEYGEVPEDLSLATLLLVDHLYQHRGPTENVSVSMVPYSIDFLVKPYMKLI
jgi:uncharacterized phage protein (predicted DNA packaging)